MRFSKLSLIGAAVVLGSCVTVGALAQAGAGQPPPGGGRRGGGGFGQGRFGGGFGGGISLVNAPVDVLATELKLTADQKTAITEAQKKYQTDLRASFQPPADGGQPDFQAIRAKQTEMSAKTTKEIEDILKDQKADAATLIKNLQTLQSLRIPIQTYSDLKLTAEEKTKLTALGADVAKDMAAKQQELQAARQAQDQAKMQEILQSMRGGGGPNEKALAVLTTEQKDLVTKYIKDHPPVQGRRPGFGPGAGAGAAGAAPPPAI